MSPIRNAAGIEFLFKKYKVDYIRGAATVDKAGAVKVKLSDGKDESHSAPKILIGTGVVARPLPGLAFNGRTVIGSREAMILETQPKSMIIIGAGAIGVEFAYFYNAFGTKVTMVEMMPNILPVEDTEVSQTLEKSFAKQGIKLLTKTKTTKTEVSDQGVKVTLPVRKARSRRSKPTFASWRSECQPLLPPGNLKLE
jgi:dihydrolipoamide dehydrogenase